MYNFWNIWISSSAESCSLSVKSVGSRLPDTRHQLYCQAGYLMSSSFPTLSDRDGSTSLGTWHVWTLNRISIGSLGRRSDRPVIGEDLVDALVPAGWGRLILVYTVSQHRDPLSLEKGQWPHALETYCRHGNTPSWGTLQMKKVILDLRGSDLAHPKMWQVMTPPYNNLTSIPGYTVKFN